MDKTENSSKDCLSKPTFIYGQFGCVNSDGEMNTGLSTNDALPGAARLDARRRNRHSSPVPTDSTHP
ncbi:hypothetical protein U0E23_13240 [Burkholderia stagnalis]|uniref:hypothetical protein n=1 Tax=Burkholderia stagnalis TaxID=1503054 RepID=UPI002AB37AF6|nr:hypothetical protein [Burkholderia stagnalis]MDY7803423.1 hypothetical protein [Burkholderia stagnalis]